jgi:hypothetical protein
VTTYTITITADDHSAATTRLRLDTSGDQVILTDLHLHDGKGLSTGQLPAIDYGLLLRAIATTTPTPLSSPPASMVPPAQGRDATPAPTGVTAQAPARRRTRTVAPAPAPTARRRGRGSAGAPAAAGAAAAAQPAPGGRTRRASSGTKAANKAAAAANKSVRAARKTTKATAAKAGGRASGGTGRAYRRMPDDFAAAYQQAGSAAAVADHYQVPRHTANGWIRRLRQQGIIPAGR